MNIEDEMRAALEDALSDPRPHHHTAVVPIRFDKDGDARLSTRLEAWLKKAKGDWAVHYHGASETEREALFMFERETDRDALVRWLS